MTSHTARITLGLAATAVLGVSLTGCVGGDFLGGDPLHGSWSWDDLEQARESDEGFRVPELVPADATELRLFNDQRAYGNHLSFVSEEGLTADYCEPSDIDVQTTLPSGWWPEETPERGWTCGWWQVFEGDDAIYAWDSREGTPLEGSGG